MKNKITIILGVIIIFALFKVAVEEGQKVSFNESYEPDQPISFSHKIHAGENQVQCLYCHFGAEKGRHAGVPPTELCMNCHTQIRKDSPEIAKVKKSLELGEPIEWIKVHHLPDFAYFNHAQHVKVGKVSCQQCHGPVETMTRMRQQNSLNMGWCIDCHRKKDIFPPAGHKGQPGADCAKCHY